jgi:hypothetical protein
VQYFSVDQDVATQACGLRCVPVVEKLRYTDTPAVLLDAHRAPDEWYAIACSMPNLIIQGDPDALRPRGCTQFAVELARLTAPPPCLERLNLVCADNLAAAVVCARGKWVVLVGSREALEVVYRHLRPDGVRAGDLVHDRYGRSGIVDAILPGGYVSVDGGRRAIVHWEQHLVVSPSRVRAGEYDTVIVTPDVAYPLARAVCRRARYMLIGVAHSPYGYL